MRALLFFIVAFGIQVVFGQQYQLKNYNADNGFNHPNTFRIYQDHFGFLWFCTEGGAFRFDGRVFSYGLSLEDSILSSSAMSICEDSIGNKLVTTLKYGIITISDSSTIGYRLDSGRYPYSCLYAQTLGSRIWLIGKDSVQYLYCINNHVIKRVAVSDDRGGDVHFNKMTKHGRRIYCASDKGVYVIDENSVTPLLAGLLNMPVVDIRQDKNGHLWVAGKHSLVEVYNGKVVSEYDLGNDKLIGNILCDSYGAVWISLYGQNMMMLQNGKLVDITKYLPMANMIINDLFEDNERNIWIATYGSGIYMIPSTAIMMAKFYNSDHTYCTSVSAMNDSTLLIGSIGKVGIYSGGQINHYKLATLANDEYVYFAKRIDSYLYVGTPFKLIRKSLFKPFSESAIYLPDKSGVVSICKDSRSRLWLGSFTGVFTMAEKAVNAKLWLRLPKEKRCNSIIQDYSGALWFGTNSGIFIYDGSRYDSIIDQRNKSCNIINMLFEDSRHQIWAATTGGVVRFAGRTPVYYDRGLNAKKCFTIAEDRSGILWVGTKRGLNYISAGSVQARKFSPGSFDKEVHSIHTTSDNRLLAATADNLYLVTFKSSIVDTLPPPTYFLAARTQNLNVKNPKAIVLPYSDRKITIDFIGISYKYPNEVEYRYKVSNLDRTWHTTTSNTLELAGLPPGDYVFVLSARKNNGRWGRQVALPIKIKTPLWLQAWFDSLVFVAISAIIIFLSKRITQKAEMKKRRQLELLNKITYLKQQALSALINPHFIFNCMNSIQHFMNRRDNDKANDYLADFAQLIRITMENAQDAFISLDKEISRLELYLSLEQLRFGENLKYRIETGHDIDRATTVIPNMIIQPFVENAIWHGIMPKDGNGLVTITFTKGTDAELVIEVKDNGIGFMPNEDGAATDKKRHFGIALTRERLQILRQLSEKNYHISISTITGEGSGTVITIVVPLLHGKDQLVTDLSESTR